MKRPRLSIFIFLFSISLFFYFFKWQQFVAFDADQDYFAKQYLEIVRNHKLTLIGIEASIGGLFVGPLYTYWTAIIYGLFRGLPYGIHLITLVVSALQAPLTYWLFSRLKNEKVGIIGGILVLCSSALWQKAFAPSPINLLYGFGLLFFFYVVNLSKDKRYIFPLAFILGLSLHVHISLFFFFPILVVFLLWKKKYAIFSKREYFITALIISIFLSPFVLFDLRHEFLLARNAFEFIKNQTDHGKLVNQAITVVQVLTDILRNQLWPTARVVSLAFLFILVIFTLKEAKKSNVYKILVMLFSSSFFLFTFYSGHISDYYLLFLFAPLYFVYSDFLLRIGQIHFGAILVSIYLVLYSYLNLTIMQKSINPYNLFIKMQAMRYLKNEVKNQPVRIYFDTELGLQFGFDYLMDYYGIIQTHAKEAPKYQVVIRPDRKIKGAFFHEAGVKEGIDIMKLD